MDVEFAYRPGEGLPARAFDAIRADGPVAWSTGLAAWVVSGYEAVKTVLGEPGRFASEGTPVQEAFGREAMLVTDSPLHHVMRAVWARRVAPQAMADRALALEQLAARSLAPAIEQLRAGGTTDLTESFQEFVAQVIAWMFEVPQTCIADLKRWNRQFSDSPALGAPKDSPEWARHLAAKAEVYDFLHAVMAERRERAAAGKRLDDLVSLMVAAEGHDGITRDIAADNLMNFFLGALDTTVKWLGNIVVFLHRRADVLDEVRRQREQLPAVMEEVMRLETVAQSLMRLTRSDTELSGVVLKAGDPVIVMLGAANRDPAVFDDPASFQLGRAGAPHLGFGFGFHHCLGAATARQETRAFLEVLLNDLPDLEVARVEYGSSWAVWGPRSLNVRLKTAR